MKRFCEVERYDSSIGNEICSCLTKIKMPLISEISFDKNKLMKKFKDIKNIINIKILKCYYLLINKKANLINIGFCSICPIFIFRFISAFSFCCKEPKKIKKIISDIIRAKKKVWINTKIIKTIIIKLKKEKSSTQKFN